METRAHYLLVGIFVLLTLAGGIFFVAWLSNTYNESAYRKVVVLFPGSVNGLSESSPVRYRGVQVGRVLNIALMPNDPNQIRVETEVLKTTPIREDTVADLQMLGITGLAFVDLSSQNPTSPPLENKSGEDYPVIQGDAATLSKMITEFPKLIKRYTEVAEDLSMFLTEENAMSFSQTLANVGNITQSLNDSRAQMQEILQELQGSTKQFERFSQTGFSELSYFLREATATMESMNTLSQTLSEDPSSILYQPQTQGYEIP